MKHKPHPNDVEARKKLAKLPKPTLEQVMRQAEASRKWSEINKKYEAPDIRPRLQ
jgi:hypothetical protein